MRSLIPNFCPKKRSHAILSVVISLSQTSYAIPDLDPPQWVAPPFLLSKTEIPSAYEVYSRVVALDFKPWDAVRGRDGEYYGWVNEGMAPGGLIYGLQPKGYFNAFNAGYNLAPGRPRRVFHFGYAPTLMAHRLQGSRPTGATAIGEDGGIYGRTSQGGVFAAGLLYKLDRVGRYVALHHFEKQGTAGGLLAAQNGTVYAATSATDTTQEGWVFRLSKNGSYRNIPVAAGQLTGLVETAGHEILLATIPSGDLPAAQKGIVWKLNANEEFEQLAVVGDSPTKLVALANGDVLCLTHKTIVQITPAGAVTVVHEFVEATEGLEPNFLTVYQNGTYIRYFGTTSTGGPRGGGTSFEINPDGNAVRVRGTFPAPQPLQLSFRQVLWMEDVFPLWVRATETNIPPIAKDDVVNAAAFRTLPGGSPFAAVPLLINDTDADKNPVTIIDVGTPQNGSVASSPTNPKALIYTSSTPVVKNDTFTYTISDGKGGTSTGHVFIRTNAAGRYTGNVSATATPSVPAGSLIVGLGSDRTANGRLEIEGKIYRFTGRFNEVNQCAAVFARANLPDTIAIQLQLRADGAKWIVDAAIQKNGEPFAGSASKP